MFWQRWSCRDFQNKPISEEAVTALLEAARWAPSGGNLQPWRFIVVKNAAVKGELALAAFGQEFLVQAPLVIAVCAVPEESAVNYGERGRALYCLQDTAAAVQNILLQAALLGLGTCWVGAFRESAVARALNLPEGEKPVALIPIGYPEGPMPQDRLRKPLTSVVRTVD